MKADRPLWIDEKGALCDAPPSRGYKIAGTAGQPIPGHIVKACELSEEGGRVMQRGELPRSPASTPAPLVADRDLFADADCNLHDEPQATGIKIAEAGRKIPVEYMLRYQLGVEDGKIVQKGTVKKEEAPENKAAPKPPNKSRKKGARGSGGLTVDSKKTGTKTSEGAS
tara:strand:+ start:1609 stop:2115 length:507 start_codon:yes stop_codon:yes gene_type:complete